MILKYLLPAFAAAGLSLAAASAIAAPAQPSSVGLPTSGVETARYQRRYRPHRRYRYGHTGRRSAPSQAGNARDPNRPVSQQNQGQTTGGPRY